MYHDDSFGMNAGKRGGKNFFLTRDDVAQRHVLKI
jgi:hypothetical protein